MNPVYIPLISALAGALIGSFSSLGAIFVQAKVGERRERIRQAAELAMAEYRAQLDNAAAGTGVYPFSTFLHHHLAIQKAIDEDDLTADRLRKIAADDEKIVGAVIEMDKAWREKLRRGR